MPKSKTPIKRIRHLRQTLTKEEQERVANSFKVTEPMSIYDIALSQIRTPTTVRKYFEEYFGQPAPKPTEEISKQSANELIQFMSLKVRKTFAKRGTAEELPPVEETTDEPDPIPSPPPVVEPNLQGDLMAPVVVEMPVQFHHVARANGMTPAALLRALADNYLERFNDLRP